MRLGLIAVFLLAAISARADECDAQTSRLVIATGAKFDHRSPSGDNVFLNHPLASSLNMLCSDRAALGRGNVSASVETGYPSAQFFDLVAVSSASALNLSPASVRAHVIECHLSALKDSDETAEIHAKDMEVDCQAFRRDGGGAVVTVWPPRSN